MDKIDWINLLMFGSLLTVTAIIGIKNSRLSDKFLFINFYCIILILTFAE
jgi:hypothetical protein